MKFISSKAPFIIASIFSFNTHAIDLVNLNDFPDWFKKAMARESEDLGKSKIVIEPLNVESEILGKAQEGEVDEGIWYYTIDIGSGSPVECYAFTEFDGPSNSLYGVIEHSLKSVEALNKKTLSSKFNYAVDSGVIQNTPYLLLDTLYNLGKDSEKVAGTLKAISAKTSNSLQICIHNEVGYRKSFFSVFESFVSAFLENDTRKPFFEPVYQISFNGMPIGFTREIYTTDEEGDINILNDTSLIIPVDAGSVARTDTSSTSWSRPDGSLINGSEHSVENGELLSQFAITRTDESWQVDGELQGKPVQKILEYKDGLLSGYGSYLEAAALKKSEADSAAFYMWTSEADPTSAMKIKLSKIKDNPEANFKVDLGPVVFKYLAGEKGIIKQGSMSQAGLTMNLRLMYLKGEPALP